MLFRSGLYLPIYLSTPIMVGGLIKLIVTKRKNKTEEEIKEDDSKGILYSSGLIAGEGLVGILLAILTVVGVADKINLGNYGINLGQGGSVVFFVLLCASLLYAATKKIKKA